ncbi:PH (Pleckstrin Homology) domain-containing protein [Roseimicrobium gellanilyticum]|uniref:PH (Pleckstrin Homology) domain-containing protein n=1 Tax=Roseimicrobium gellanilyticum TaxID=748857 RepID=A0A366HVE9_9BACT|nr:PH domain-containing protein [Roseimicrobium gellanilyticum]RBP47534.1 PH (Pleckstrin Homology) domain-containing protein [Roseimicrobium gellanilyticum]
MPVEDASPTPPATQETVLWSGHSSQWVHFWWYLFCVLLAIAAAVGALFTAGLSLVGLLIPLLMWIGRWWMTRTTKYELTSQRLRKTSGILNRTLDELELYRVKDYSVEMPLLMRIFGLGNIRLVTSDATTPVVDIPAIKDAMEVRELLRTAVQAERDRKRVRELDVDGPGGAIP